MMKISLKNVEEVIFLNKEIKDKLPEFKNYFYLWQLSKQQHFLKSVGTQAMIDLINNLNERHLNIIKEHYGVDVEFIKFSNKIVDNFEFYLNENDFDELPKICNMAIHRNKEKVFVTTWI